MTRFLKKILIRSGIAIFLAGGFQLANASSIAVQPLLLELAPSQSAAIRVRNTSEDDIPVEVLVFKRDVDANGHQTRTPADDDFIIFPPQTTLKGSSTQVFRLRSLDSTKTDSQSYYVSFRQIPVKLKPSEENGARVQVIFSFDAAVHIVPRKAKSAVALKTATASQMSIQEATGEVKSLKNGSQVDVMAEVTVPAIEIEIENNGNKYLYLTDQEFIATVTDQSGEISEHSWLNDDLRKHLIVTLLEPKESRTFTLPLPKTVIPSKVDVSVRKRKEY